MGRARYLALLAAAALAVGLVAWLPDPRLVAAQEGTSSRPSLPMPHVDTANSDPVAGDDSPPPAPSPNPPDPNAERHARFLADVEGVAHASGERVRLENARRVAPFDLEWGLE